MPRRRQSKFDYELAFSFAGEDRSHAEAIVRAVEEYRHRVFYDRDNIAHLWGKDTTEYERIYGPASRFVVTLLSKDYRRKDWTQLEFSIASREKQNRNGEFILPVRVDDTIMLGVHDDRNVVSVQSHTPQQIAEWLDEKIRTHKASKSPRAAAQRKQSAAEIALLRSDTREALELIASAAMPVHLTILERLFPEIAWATVAQALRRSKLLGLWNDRLKATTGVVDALRQDQKRWDELNNTWVAALEPLQLHIDLRVYLSMHYLRADRYNDVVRLLAEAIEYGDLGPWHRLYVSALKTMLGKRTAHLLDPELRLGAYNCVGLGLLHGFEFGEAVIWFKQLRDRSKRAGNNHLLGQAYLNLGIAHANQSLVKDAVHWYRKAEQHGRETKDWTLVGRTLGNVSQLLLRRNVKDAKAALEESLKFKRKTRDREGLAVGKAQIAAILHRTGQNEEAARMYRRAIRSLDSAQMHRDRILARIHLAIVQSQLGQKARARAELRNAAMLAEQIRVQWLRKLALGLDAQVSHELADWRGVESACKALLVCARETADSENMICALHGIGIAELLLGRRGRGRKTLAKALREATRIGNRHWMERCSVDITRPVVDGDLGEPDPPSLIRRAKGRERQKKLLAAGDLWDRLGNLLLFHNDNATEALDAYKSATRCFRAAKDVEGTVLSLARMADCYERLQDFDSSLKRLAEAQLMAESAKAAEIAAGAMNQRAILLQELGRFDEACKLHRAAVAAQRLPDNDAELAKSLHNLGESLRKAERFKEATAALREAEAIARANDDFESAISSAHSRGLVLQHQGKRSAASKVFQQCRNEAKSRQLWSEYASAWEAMANLAWCSRERPAAITRYKKALACATKYGCSSVAARVALNLANALDWVNQPRRARDLLERYGDELSRSVDSCIFHARLGDVYKACKQPAKALHQWEVGQASAAASGNSEYIAYCSAQIGTRYSEMEQYAEAERQFKLALKHEGDTENRVIVMKQLLDSLLEQQKEDEANKLFTEATELAGKEGLREYRIDLFMRLFDYCWPGTLDYKKQALRCWAAALLEAFILRDPETTGGVGGHGLGTMTTPGLAPSPAELAELKADLLSWAKATFPSTTVPVSLLTQQLEIVEGLLPHIGKGPQMRRAARAIFSRL